MNEIITRCPSCSLSFRAMPAHLQAANGLVRCGACLKVFDARENLVDGSLADRHANHAPSDQNDDASNPIEQEQ
ncbi:MJ0042-type zinc finger domain-containing protein [Porticoccus sp.]|uniref:MJ0042-type zinc finger domain-containing protein n=1 Tax=Porticoccus sp. TaxID=2024853 RepID=UPI003F699398